MWAKHELFGQEVTLVEQYNIRSYVLVEGNPAQEKERALKMAGALAVVVLLLTLLMIGFAGLGVAIALALIVFLVGSLAIYKNIREMVTVEEILDGRHFSCREYRHASSKEGADHRDGSKVYAVFRGFKELGGREVIEMAPDRLPIARFVERPQVAE